MTDHPPATLARPRPPIRWWPVVVLLLAATTVILWLRADGDASFQRRNLQSLGVGMGAAMLLLLWWVAFSRARWKLRLAVTVTVLSVGGLGAGLFRIRGVSGDLLPIIEPRWARSALPAVQPVTNAAAVVPLVASTTPPPDFPQFLGPDRTAVLREPVLDPDWKTKPPQLRWRKPVGAAWSGFAIVGALALTQEQHGEQELVTCCNAVTGDLIWSHADAARYATTIAGEGPRCTPTVVSNRVFTLGATGILNCLDLATGQRRWSRNIATDAKAGVPEWGFSGSPLVVDGLVVVSAGGQPDQSLLAYRATDGGLAWAAGSAPTSHASPFLATLAGQRQILAFNSRRITAHEPATGSVLWEYPWGTGQPHVAVPVIVGTNGVVFSSGYGVGAELLAVAPDAAGQWTASRVWQSRRMKAKFANPVARDGFLYGLDDGILACVDLKDGSQPWKEGRYGHGQGLLLGELLLLMAESGELILLRPTPLAPNELGRFRVFASKTWNPIALAGHRLIVRNDKEAACLELPVAAANGR